MLTLIHVLVAVASLVVATFNLVSPSKYKLRLVFGLSTLTVASGTALVVSDSAHILATCITGLIYISVIAATTAAAQYRLYSK